MSELAKLDKIHRALAEVTTITAAKEIHDQASAMRVYSNSLEDKNKCAEIVIRAERLMGEMLREEVRHEGGRPKSKLTQIIKITKRYQAGTVLPDGISKNQSSRFQKAASVPVEEFEKHITRVKETEGGEITTNVSLRLASSLERDRRAKGMKTTSLPVGIFRVIYADPPWSYGNSGVIGSDNDHYGRAKRHYSTMSTKDICEMGVRERAAEDSVLFLWTTSPLLEESFRVINAWGFKYKSSFVWHKLRHNFAHYNSMRHEFLLVSTRGSCLPDSKKLLPSVVEIDRGEHSGKPVQFREMIDSLYIPPQRGIDRIELFARGNTSKHWKVWGNESGE